MDEKPEQRRLGRGLSALMSEVQVTIPTSPGAVGLKSLMVAVARLVANPQQPRRDFAPAALEDLAASIRQKGVVQPLIVRPIERGDRLEIVAGERRWRAAQMAGLHEVPVIIRDFDDLEVIEIAIIENIQRADLNAIEEAEAYRHLMDRFGHTQEKLAEALSRSRSYVANLLRLLNLPDDVRELLRRGDLTAGHARALITSADPSRFAREVVTQGLSVRATEQLVATKVRPVSRASAAGDASDETTAATTSAALEFSAMLQRHVSIKRKGNGGVVLIKFESQDDLDRLRAGLAKMAPQNE